VVVARIGLWLVLPLVLAGLGFGFAAALLAFAAVFYAAHAMLMKSMSMEYPPEKKGESMDVGLLAAGLSPPHDLYEK
jgi:hypothetical protein